MNASRKVSRRWEENCRDAYRAGKRRRRLMRIGLSRKQANDIIAGLLEKGGDL